MTTKNDLLKDIAMLRAEIEALKTDKNTFFQRKPERDDAYLNLINGQIPVFIKNEKLSLYKKNEPSIVLVEGDNLPALVAFQDKYAGSADVIYIDPPYNTGKDVYTYSDSYKSRLDKHSRWVSFMERRLFLARDLLQETGIIMCAIGIEELSRLKLLMDTLFGEENFVANITWSGSSINNARFVSTSSDYMLIYAKNIEATKEASAKWRTQKHGAEQLLEIAEAIWIEVGHDSQKATKNLRRFYVSDEAKEIFQIEPGLKMYNAIDNEGRLYRASDLSSPSGHGGTYAIVNPHTGTVVAIPKRGWVHSMDTFQEKIDADQILWNGEGVPSFKRYLKDNLSVVLKDVIQKDRDFANKLLAKQIGRSKFSYPKDHNTLAEWLEYVIPKHRKDDVKSPPLIMDFFAGSGSTAHAVAQLNSLDQGNRSCVLVTTNEAGISKEVTAKRIRALLSGEWADEKFHTPLRGSLSYYETQFIEPVRNDTKLVRPLILCTTRYITQIQKTVEMLKKNHLIF